MAFKATLGSLKLIPSSGGVFEVTFNGSNVYTKKATGEFPDADAVVADVKWLL